MKEDSWAGAKDKGDTATAEVTVYVIALEPGAPGLLVVPIVGHAEGGEGFHVENEK